MDRVVRRGLNVYVYEWILVYITHNILMLWRHGSNMVRDKISEAKAILFGKGQHMQAIVL